MAAPIAADDPQMVAIGPEATKLLLVGEAECVGCVGWGNTLEGSARELLTDPNQVHQDDARSAIDAATDFLTQVLGDGRTPTKTIEAEAKAAGLSWANVRRAADSLGVMKRKGSGA